jgi:hypothetical protein
MMNSKTGELMGLPSRLAGCFFGVSGGSQSSSSQTVTNPEVLARLDQNVARAKSIADAPYTPYSGQLSAGTNPFLQQAGAALPGAATAGADTLNAGAKGATDLLAFKPQNINPASSGLSVASPASINRGDVGNVQGGEILPGISKYMNPYTDSVVNSTLGDLERARQMQRVNDQQKATQANAFGGSRSGVADSLTNEAFGRTAASTAANLRQSGFNTAAGLSESDAARGLNAGQSNQAADLNVANQNAVFKQQGGQFNAANELQNNQFNTSANNAAQLANQNAGIAGAGLNLNAANLSGQLGGQQQDQALSGASALSQFGTQQQSTEQSALDRLLQQFQYGDQRQIDLQQLVSQAFGFVPGALGTNSKSSGWNAGLSVGKGS